jgi:hypothetical protein
LRNLKPSLPDFINVLWFCCASANNKPILSLLTRDLVFDAKDVVILSLWWIFCACTITGGPLPTAMVRNTLEVLFAHYDCHLRRSDVKIELMVEIAAAAEAVDEGW